MLLRNESVNGASVLPLSPKSALRIAVLGRLADVNNLGDGGSSNVRPPSVVTPLDGLREALPNAKFTRDAATAADLAIVVVGYTSQEEGEYTFAASPELFALMPPFPDAAILAELAQAQDGKSAMAVGGDRRSLRLRPEDEDLILATAATQPRTIVLLMSGSAILAVPWIGKVGAALMVWYPGMEGGHAIADVLTGAVNPSGRLPFVVPTDERHLPAFDPDAREVTYDAWHGQWLLDRDGHAARYPFGFGLSYTVFRLEQASRQKDTALVQVTNCGQRDGAVVVFAFDRDGHVARLIDLRKVRIAAGVTVTVALSVGQTRAVRVAQYSNDPNGLNVPPTAPLRD